jgi:hypothetical protein
MQINYKKHEIFASIGYLTVIASYIEHCIEDTHAILHNNASAKKPISILLDDTKHQLIAQPNYHLFSIDRTITFFEKRNEIIHGQIYGIRGSSKIKINHRRKGIVNKITDESNIERLIEEGVHLLKRWEINKRIKPT